MNECKKDVLAGLDIGSNKIVCLIGFTNSDGKLVSTTLFEVDGARRRQYQATSIVIDVLEDAAAKQKFLAGELSEYSPTSSELKDYTLSDALYQVDETYTMSLFFNTNLDA